jgi:hypothetical protein
MPNPPITFKVKVDAEKTTAEFKQARKELNQKVKTGLIRAGERFAMPEARRRAPKFIASTIVVKSTTRSAYLTTSLRGKKGRVVGLLEYGGTRKDKIVPTKKKAMTINGGFATTVTAPRTYKGKKFMNTAVEARLPETEEAIKDEVLLAFSGLETR